MPGIESAPLMCYNKMDGDYVQKVEVTTPDDGTLKEMEKYFAGKKRNT